MVKEIKDILKEYNKDIKRHIDVLREDFDGKVALIGEQYSSIQEKYGSIQEKYSSIQEKYSSIQEKYGSIQEKLEFHDKRFDSLERNIEIVKTDIVIIKNSLKKKVDVEDFEVLEGRVRVLESKIK